MEVKRTLKGLEEMNEKIDIISIRHEKKKNFGGNKEKKIGE